MNRSKKRTIESIWKSWNVANRFTSTPSWHYSKTSSPITVAHSWPYVYALCRAHSFYYNDSIYASITYSYALSTHDYSAKRAHRTCYANGRDVRLMLTICRQPIMSIFSIRMHYGVIYRLSINDALNYLSSIMTISYHDTLIYVSLEIACYASTSCASKLLSKSTGGMCGYIRFCNIYFWRFTHIFSDAFC